MEQAVLVGDDFHEGTEGHDGNNLAVIYLANLGHLHDGANLGLASLDVFLVLGGNLHDTLLVVFGDDDDGVGFLLHLLDDLATGADDGTNHILRDIHGLDARHKLLIIGARLGDGLSHLVEDVQTALTGLLQGLGQNLVGEAINLDVHLAGGDTVAGASNLEVHVAKVVFVAEDVGQNGVFSSFAVANHTHSHTSDGLAHRHASVHQCEATATHRGH